MLFRAVFLIVCGFSAMALADPAAEKLFQDGRAAMAAGKLDEACDLFRRSDTIEPRVGTVANLADCEERRGRIATAWAAFVDTEARAQRTHDPRAAYAAKRGSALAPRLPYLTIAVTPALRTIGVAVHRNGVVVDPAEYDRKLPFDPGPYRIDVDAAGYASWHQDVQLVEGKETRVEVPPLVASAEPPAKPDKPADRLPPPAVVAKAEPPAADYHIGAGLLTGLSSDLDWIYGGRVVANVAPLGPGVLRVVPSIMHSTSKDPADVYHLFKLYALGTTFEYAYPVTPRLIAAGGLGVGVDLQSDNYGNSSNNGWGSLRLSPTLRFDRLDIGVHIQFVLVSGRVVTLFELGADLFVW